MKMKILHLLVWGVLGGLESTVVTLLSHYPDKNTEHVVAYVYGEGNCLESYYPGFRVLQQQLENIPNTTLVSRGSSVAGYYDNENKFYENVVALKELVKQVKPDVIHVPKYTDFLYAYQLHIETGLSIVPVLHDPVIDFKFTCSALYKPMLQSYVHYGVTGFIGNLYREGLAGLLKANDIPSLGILSNGVDQDLFSFSLKERNRIRALYSIPKDALLIGMVGSVDERKRQLWGLEALENMLKKGYKKTQLYICIVGEGLSKDALKKYVKEKGLGENVIFAGAYSSTAPFYSAFDIFIHPSKIESFGLVIVEALSCDLPVLICTPYEPCGTEEDGYGIVQNGYNGLVVNAQDKQAFFNNLEELVKSQKLRSHFSSIARKSVEKFNVQKMAESYHKIFTLAANA